MSDKIREFPKTKRITPDEMFSPVFHECMDNHYSLKWMLQFRDGKMVAICSDCSEKYDIINLIAQLGGEE